MRVASNLRLLLVQMSSLRSLLMLLSQNAHHGERVWNLSAKFVELFCGCCEVMHPDVVGEYGEALLARRV